MQYHVILELQRWHKGQRDELNLRRNWDHWSEKIPYEFYYRIATFGQHFYLHDLIYACDGPMRHSILLILQMRKIGSLRM